MNPRAWLPIERRFLSTLLAAMLPAHDGWPGLAGIDLARFWSTYQRAAPPLLRFGLRTSVWILGLSPPLLLGRPHTVLGLDEDARDLLLTRAATSRLPLLAAMATTLKLVGCLAYFHEPSIETRLRALGTAP